MALKCSSPVSQFGEEQSAKKERTQFKVPIGKYSRGEYGVWVFGCLDVVMSRCMDVRVFTYREIMAPSLALPRS